MSVGPERRDREDAAERCFFDVAARLGPADAPPSLHVAAAGGPPEVVYEGFRRQPATELALLHTRSSRASARRLADAFRGAGVPVSLHLAEDEPYLGMLRAVHDLVHASRLTFGSIVLNAGSGSDADGCALTTAAYLHGLPAFHAEAEMVCPLPVLPGSQRDLLGERDVALLLALAATPRSDRALARAARLERSSLRARLDGDPERKGLVALALVERFRRFGILPRLRLTPAGRTLVAGGALTSRFPTVQHHL